MVCCFYCSSKSKLLSKRLSSSNHSVFVGAYLSANRRAIAIKTAPTKVVSTKKVTLN